MYHLANQKNKEPLEQHNLMHALSCQPQLTSKCTSKIQILQKIRLKISCDRHISCDGLLDGFLKFCLRCAPVCLWKNQNKIENYSLLSCLVKKVDIHILLTIPSHNILIHKKYLLDFIFSRIRSVCL